MWNEPTELQLQSLPRLYAAESDQLDRIMIYMHFFYSCCDWYISEFDGKDLFFGFAILHGDLQNAEWGYMSFREMKAINVHGVQIDRDVYWMPKPAGEIPKIALAHGWSHPEKNNPPAVMSDHC